MKEMKHIIISYYLIIAGVFALYTYFAPIDQSMDGTITVILSVFLLVFPIVMIHTLRYALHVFLFVLAFISGFYGFYYHSVDDHSISNALYFTFGLYLLQTADVFSQDGLSTVTYPFLLEIARWSAASYTISTIFIAMYRSLEKKIALFFAQLFGGHHIIFSYNEKSHHLIHDLRKNGARVIIVDDQFSSETQSMLEKMKVIVIQTSIEDESVFHVCAAKKAKSIALFHENDRDSLTVLMNLQKFSLNASIEFRFDQLIIHIEDYRFQQALQTFLEKVEHFSFPVVIMNVYKEVAKEFWRKHQQIFEEEAHLLVVGYNQLGEQITTRAIKTYEENHKKHKMTITILEDSRSQKQMNQIEWVPFNLLTDSLEDVILQQKQVCTHIFICLDEDIDLMEGIELSESFDNTPIYMYFTDDHIEQTLMIAEVNSSLQSTGMIKDVLTKEHLQL